MTTTCAEPAPLPPTDRDTDATLDLIAATLLNRLTDPDGPTDVVLTAEASFELYDERGHVEALRFTLDGQPVMTVRATTRTPS